MGYFRNEKDRRRGKKPVAVVEYERLESRRWASEEVVILRRDAVALGLEFNLPSYGVKTVGRFLTWTERVVPVLNADGDRLVIARLPLSWGKGHGVDKYWQFICQKTGKLHGNYCRGRHWSSQLPGDVRQADEQASQVRELYAPEPPSFELYSESSFSTGVDVTITGSSISCELVTA